MTVIPLNTCATPLATLDGFAAQCIPHVAEALKRGLSHFSGHSRVALLYAESADSPMRAYDPQRLLKGHEPLLAELYLQDRSWRQAHNGPDLGDGVCETPQLSGLVSCGGHGQKPFYQVWFTEHHPDMCTVGPTQRWLEYAAGVLAAQLSDCRGARLTDAEYVLSGYATHSVRDHIIDTRARLQGPDTALRVYPMLDAVLAVSKTREEGAWARGRILFCEPEQVRGLNFQAKFPPSERPVLSQTKHVRKLLTAVATDLHKKNGRVLVSDGHEIVGIANGPMPVAGLCAEFRGSYGFLYLQDEVVASFSDGHFSSSNRRAKLVQLEELLLEEDLESQTRFDLFNAVSSIVHMAQERYFGTVLAIDLGAQPMDLAGQNLEHPLDLTTPEGLEMAASLAKLDGALHLTRDVRLPAFACLLDGRRTTGEDRARGARYNSTLRFTAEHPNFIGVVVSSDRPVSVVRSGVELTAQCEWLPDDPSEQLMVLEEWVGEDR